VPIFAVLDRDDRRIEPYRAVRERDLVGRGRAFMAEGEVVLRTLIERSPFAIDSVLLADNQAERLGPWIAATRPDLPIYRASRAVMEAIAGFPIHRGILAVGRRGPQPDTPALLAGLGDPALVLGLVGLANHDNVGGIFRNAAAFGVGAVLLDETSCDPLYRKAIRVSVGASLTVPFARAGDAAAMLEALGAAGFDIVALSPGGQQSLSDLAWSPRTALLLGTEGEGLPAAVMTRVRTASIAMAAGFDSLNVATTSGIALYEARLGIARSHQRP
jgi:tRNA G18 (ribose-2'-O)-methylase SpoU